MMKAVQKHKRIFRINTWFRFKDGFYGMGTPVAPIRKAVMHGLLGDGPLTVTVGRNQGFNWKFGWSGRIDQPRVLVGLEPAVPAPGRVAPRRGDPAVETEAARDAARQRPADAALPVGADQVLRRDPRSRGDLQGLLDPAGALVGILTKHDCMRVAFGASYEQRWGGPVSEYMSSPVETVDAGQDVILVAEMFLEHRYRRFPVIDDGRVVGVISRHDVLAALQAFWGAGTDRHRTG